MFLRKKNPSCVLAQRSKSLRPSKYSLRTLGQPNTPQRHPRQATRVLVKEEQLPSFTIVYSSNARPKAAPPYMIPAHVSNVWRQGVRKADHQCNRRQAICKHRRVCFQADFSKSKWYIPSCEDSCVVAGLNGQGCESDSTCARDHESCGAENTALHHPPKFPGISPHWVAVEFPLTEGCSTLLRKYLRVQTQSPAIRRPSIVLATRE
jgi:hypothetical protein